MSLYPTPTRLALLRDVDAGEVIEGGIGEEGAFILDWPGEPIKVTCRIVGLQRAGWVELDDDSMHWRLTDAGRAVLDGAP